MCSIAFQILQKIKEEGSFYAEMFCVIRGSHYVKHYWACSALASSPLGGGVISSQSHFTLHVPFKESMLRHIRKSPRLIKPLIFCDASTLLNTIYRTAVLGHSVCFMETPLIQKKKTLSCGYGYRAVCETVYVSVRVVFAIMAFHTGRVGWCMCDCVRGWLWDNFVP